MPSEFFSGVVGLFRSPVRRDFLFLLIDRGVRLVVGFVMAGMIARHLNTEAYGWLAYAGTVMALGSTIAQLGFDGIAVREVVRRPTEADVILGAAFVLRIGVGLVTATGIWCCLPFIAGDEPIQRRLVLILALGTLTPALGLPVLWFQARTESRVAVGAAFIGFFAAVAWRLVLVTCEASVEAFAWAGLGETVLSSVLVAIAWARRGGGLRFKDVGKHARALLSEGLPLLAGSIAVTIYMRTDVVMLRWLVNADAVGIYNAATRLSEAGYAIPMLLANSTLATLTAASSDEDRLNAMTKRYFQLSAALAYAFVVPLILISPWLLRLLFGQSFASAGAVGQIHLLSVFFVFLGVARGQLLVVRGFSRFVMVASLAGALLNVGLNALLIPLMGPSGAAVATVASFAVSAWLSGYIYRPIRSLASIQLRAMVWPIPGPLIRPST